MTENMNAQPAGEEPDNTAKMEAQLPDVDELPTVTDEATQTAVIAEPTNVPETPPVVDEATQITPNVPETPQAVPAAIPETPHAPASDQSSAPTPSEVPAQPAHFQPGDPTVYTAQPGQLPYIAPEAYSHTQYAPLPGQTLPPYPGQPGAPVPTTKRRRPLLWVALVIVALLLIGGGTAFAIVQNQQPLNTPTQVLQQYCHSFTTFNAKEMYDTFSAASQERMSEAQLQKSFDMLKGFGNLMKFECTVSDVQQTGSTTASGKINLMYSISVMGVSASGSVPISMSLTLENRAWKIDESSSGTPNIQIPTMPAFPTFPPSLLTPTTTNN